MSEERMKALQRMARERPEDPRLQFGLAVELLKLGDIEAGVVSLRSYLAHADDDGNGWGRLGAALVELGDMEGAKNAYERGMEIARGRGHYGLADEFQEVLEGLT